MSIEKKIPTSFKLFASTVNVVWDNKRMNDKQLYGEASYSELKITLSTTDGVDQLSEHRITDCFYHEKVHMIPDSMHEYELSKNERFVDQFAKLLRQSDETAEYCNPCGNSTYEKYKPIEIPLPFLPHEP